MPAFLYSSQKSDPFYGISKNIRQVVPTTYESNHYIYKLNAELDNQYKTKIIMLKVNSICCIGRSDREVDRL